MYGNSWIFYLYSNSVIFLQWSGDFSFCIDTTLFCVVWFVLISWSVICPVHLLLSQCICAIYLLCRFILLLVQTYRGKRMLNVLLMLANRGMVKWLSIWICFLYWKQLLFISLTCYPLCISHISSHPPPAFGLSPDLELALEAEQLHVHHGNDTVSTSQLYTR